MHPSDKRPNKHILPLLLLLSAAFLYSGMSFAAGCSTKAPPVAEEMAYYNDGVGLMQKKKFDQAEHTFRQSLKYNEKFAEAHNNLACTLRKQGPENFTETLEHYSRAIELNPPCRNRICNGLCSLCRWVFQ